MKSYLKWVGGKGKLMESLFAIFPCDNINNFIEPFAGSASAALSYIIRFDNEEIFNVQSGKMMYFLNDVNKALINTHLQVKNNSTKLIKALEKNQLAYENSVDKKSFYYDKRKELNVFIDKFYNNKLSSKEKILFAALFILINKTCFNGMWRVNSKNEYNIPWNQNENVNVYNKSNIEGVSSLFRKVSFFSMDFYDFTKSKVKKGDFVFLDPPYIPINETSFTSYNKEEWSDKDDIRLKELLDYIDNIGARFMMTNSNAPRVRELFHSSNWNITEISAHRFIKPVKAKNNEKRKKVTELVIRNYE